MKFFIAIVILAGLNLGLTMAQTNTTAPAGTQVSPSNNPAMNPASNGQLNRQDRMNQMYPPDSINSPWPPFNQPRPGTIPGEQQNQQNFPTPQPLPPNQTPPQQINCLPPGAPASSENPNLLPCPTPGTNPAPNGIDPNIPTKAEITR